MYLFALAEFAGKNLPGRNVFYASISVQTVIHYAQQDICNSYVIDKEIIIEFPNIKCDRYAKIFFSALFYRKSYVCNLNL